MTHPATANLQAYPSAVASLPACELHERDGRQLGGREPWVQARVSDLEEPEVPGGVTIEEVDDEAGQRALGFHENGWVSRRLGGM